MPLLTSKSPFRKDEGEEGESKRETRDVGIKFCQIEAVTTCYTWRFVGGQPFHLHLHVHVLRPPSKQR